MPNYGVMALGKDGVIDMIGQSIGPADASVTVSNPSLWPSSGTVFVNMSDTEQAVGTISGGVITFLARAVAPYNGLSTAQPHTGGDKIVMIASWAAMQSAFPVKLDEFLLAAPAASITFPNQIPSIPQIFRTLRIRYQARDNSVTNGQDFMQAQFNDDVGATQYAGTRLNIATSSVTGQDQAAQAQAIVGIVQGGGSFANCAAAGEIVIPNYSGTTFFKEFHGMVGTTFTTHDMDFFTGFWQSVAAITKIKLLPALGSFIAGSLFTLYGEP